MTLERPAYARNLRDNLRLLCKAKGNIAAICRDIGINRQQFNKYLSGDSLPTSHNMRRICTYFGVPEEFLLAETSRAAAFPASVTAEPKIAAMLAELAAQTPRSMAMGYYFAYYPMIADPKRLVRVVVAIAQRGDSVVFSRYTRMREAGITTKYYPRGKHVGIVMQKNDMIFMLAVNRVGFQDISLMTFGALMNNSPHLRTGIAMIMSPWGPIASRVTLEYIGRTANRRQVLRQCQIVAADSPEVDPLIRKSLTTQPSWPTAQLEPYGHMQDWGALQS